MIEAIKRLISDASIIIIIMKKVRLNKLYIDTAVAIFWL